MVIGVCGLGYTGSGAVIDLLKEYSGIQVQKGGEFWLSYRPDGLEDLSYHVNNPARFNNGDAAIMRFQKLIESFCMHSEKWGLASPTSLIKLSKQYVDSISQVKWRGYWTLDARLESGIRFHIKWRLLKKLYNTFPSKFEGLANKYLDREMHLSYKPTDFYAKTRQFVTEFLSIIGYDDEQLLFLDQGFSGDNPVRSFPFFRNPKAIVVDKDPRDLYVLCKREVHPDSRWVPTDDVSDFITYYRVLRSNYAELKRQDILLVKFEDLIYQYEETVRKIEYFSGVSPKQHIAPQTYFRPDISKNNTQLFRKYPDLSNDISKIEKELEEYLYDYDDVQVIHKFGRAF